MNRAPVYTVTCLLEGVRWPFNQHSGSQDGRDSSRLIPDQLPAQLRARLSGGPARRSESRRRMRPGKLAVETAGLPAGAHRSSALAAWPLLAGRCCQLQSRWTEHPRHLRGDSYIQLGCGPLGQQGDTGTRERAAVRRAAECPCGTLCLRGGLYGLRVWNPHLPCTTEGFSHPPTVTLVAGGSGGVQAQAPSSSPAAVLWWGG